MLIGLMSDSHGRVRRVRAALDWFDARGAEFVLHCGDVGDLDVFELFVGRSLRFVWGNTDDATPRILAFLERTGIIAPPTPPLELTLDDRRFIVVHGHEACFDDLMVHPNCDYLCHGHTHRRADRRIGSCRVINPGALHRAEVHTVALLDTRSDHLMFHEVP